MNRALKVTELEENNTKLNAKDNAHPGSLTNLDADAIRSKIKAARLEKLMARQLESELSIELDTSIAPLEDDTTVIIDEEIIIQKIEETIELAIPASKARGYSTGSSKRMRNIQSTRHSCDEMVSRIRSGSDILSGLNEQTTNLVKQLQFMEQEFSRFEEAKPSIRRVRSSARKQ